MKFCCLCLKLDFKDRISSSQIGELVLLLQPAEDKLVGLGWLELWSHVASTVDSSESKITGVGLRVASNLSSVHVWSPVLGGVPSKCSDPVLGSDGWNGTIGVTRVVEHSDLALEFLVDPLRTSFSSGVVDLGRAKVPSLNIVGNVEGLSDDIEVQVVKKTRAVSAWWKLSQHAIAFCDWSLEPWGVVVLGEASLLGLVHLWEWSGAPACSKDVVDVYIRDKAVEFDEVGKTFFACFAHVWS